MTEHQFRSLVTQERLTSYDRATTSARAARALYEWNIHASAAVLEVTGLVEVIARNALDRELHRWATRRRSCSEWFDVVPLDDAGRVDLAKARSRATRHGRQDELHGAVVAELSFGFWRYLVETRYLTALWTPSLHRAFPNGPTDILTRQREVRRRMQQLHFVRNRAAHHEPIHARDLHRDLDYAIELLSWIDPIASQWAADLTSLRAVLDARPGL